MELLKKPKLMPAGCCTERMVRTNLSSVKSRTFQGLFKAFFIFSRTITLCVSSTILMASASSSLKMAYI